MKEYPLYDATYTLYRSSPLYNGNAPILTSLGLHARRLKDQLRADGLRAQIIVGDTTYSGVLNSCEWSLLGDEASWSRLHGDEENDDDISVLNELDVKDALGILIELKYERITHRAIFMGKAEEKQSLKGFTSFPLLLTRMPASLRDIVLQYFRQAFDCRITAFKLRSSRMYSALDKSIAVLTQESDSNTDRLAKGCQVQLGFPSAAPDLRSLDMLVPRENIEKFVEVGQLLTAPARQTNDTSVASKPFIATLSAYLKQHTTISLDHPGVVLSKFACGPIVLSIEGKIKITKNPVLTDEIWSMLIDEARTNDLEQDTETFLEDEALPTRSGQPSASQKVSKGPVHQVASTLGSADDQIPSEPPPPYELHDPSLTSISGM